MEHKGTKTIETDRLLLRKFCAEDTNAAYANWTSDEKVTEFLRWPTHTSVETTEKVIKAWIRESEKPDFYQWAIVLKDINEPIGTISVVDKNDDLNILHIGYCIGSKWWHKGITSEAFSAIIPYLFNEVGANRIESQHDPDNPHSGNVMKKCGLTYEGTLRQADISNKGIVDACVYSLLKAEWTGERESRPSPPFEFGRLKMNLREELFALQDASYGDFQAKLTPGIPRELFIGVRVPEVRKLAKRAAKEPEAGEFLADLPHKYYDENMLHGLLVSEIKDYDTCIAAVDKFLPYIDNWAVCDIMSPKVFKRNKTALLGKIKEWCASEKTYTCRFGIEMLMSHFLDDDFKAEYLDIPGAVRSDEYYVQMMCAWFFATALAKQWDETVKYIEENRLDTWVHNKTLQKARESFRITPEQKEYLKTLKR